LGLRRLLLLVGAIVLVDTMFYAAIAPLLPHYRDELGLSKTAAGLLAGAYPAGTFLGSIPAGWLAARWGVRPTVLLGLGLLSASSLAFGFAKEVAVLDAARFLQGLGGAASWAGGLAWLVRVAPAARRGEMIGSAFGAAIGGALLGPALGAAAVSVGTEAAFAAVAAVGVALAVWAAREPAPPPAERVASGGAAATLRSGRMRAGAALVIFVGLYFGVAEVLVPLRLDELGASGLLIGATFVATAALQAASSPWVGRVSDRRGPIPPILVSLAAGVVLALLLPLPERAGVLMALCVAGVPVVASVWVPGMALLSEGAEAVGLDQAYAFAVVNLVWSVAQLAGSAGGGAVADAAGDALAYGAVAAMSGAGLVVALRTIGRPWPRPT
jgi:predicted MFS family arabinose efflux permease